MLLSLKQHCNLYLIDLKSIKTPQPEAEDGVEANPDAQI